MSVSDSQTAAAAATELVQELVRVFKVRRLYDSGHPQRKEVESVAARRLSALLAEESMVELDVSETVLTAGGEVVYEQAAGPESLAHILFREGLRQVAFVEGLSEQELGGFLDEVAQASQQRAEDEFDLVARLWEQRFVHIRYAFVEALSDEDWTPPAEERAREERQRIRVVLAEDDRSALERPQSFLLSDPTLYFLDDEDMAELQAALDDEKGRALFVEVLTCLRELLFDPVVNDIGPALEMIEEIHAEYLKDEIYRRVIEIHEIFAPYLESEQAAAEATAAFGRMRESALDGRMLGRLTARLLAGEVEEREASDFLRVFGAGRLPKVLAGIPEIKRVCQVSGVAAALGEIAASDEAGLRESLGSEVPGKAVAAAFLVGLTGDGRLLEALGAALLSSSPEVRREAVLALKSFGGGRALEYVAPAVDDADPAVRLYALRHLVTHRYAPALARVTARLERPDPDRSLTEERLLHEAWGALGGEAVVGELASRLRKRRGWFRSRDPELVACLLIGLGATRSVAAREVVEQALGDRHPLVSRVAEQVLDSWGAEAREP